MPAGVLCQPTNHSTKQPLLDGIILHVRVSVSRRLVLIRIIPLDAESCEIHDDTESEDGEASPVGGGSLPSLTKSPKNDGAGSFAA